MLCSVNGLFRSFKKLPFVNDLNHINNMTLTEDILEIINSAAIN